LKSTQTEELAIRGAKGRKDRLAYATNGSADALGDWIGVRGGDDGALFCSVNKGGRIRIRRLTDQAVLHILRKRAAEAGVSSFSPHDLRRTFISDLLDAGADASTAQQLAGHSNVQTTTRYDRRGEATERMPVPEGLDFIQTAVPEAFVTAHESLFHLGRLEATKSVLIRAAASGVGSSAVQMAHVAGARIFATASAAKLERVSRLGADLVVDRKAQDFAESVAAATAGRGVDVVIDFVGPPYFERNVRSLGNGGRLIQVGLMGGVKTVPLPLSRLVLGHLQIVGTIMKSRSQPAKQAMVRRLHERW
jgi:NADPH:quinone reductase-like Zn-dependent oxidoreductase